MLSFVGIKLFALGLSSARSLVLAAILGPKSYGMFGTLILLQQYLSYTALGMREGVAVGLARSEGGSFEVLSVYGSALSWGAGVGLMLWIAAWIAHGSVGEVGQYLVLLGAIASLSILNEILININRDQNKLKKIALLEVAYNAVPLGVALWLWEDVTIPAVLAALAVGLLVSVVGYLTTLPQLRFKHVQWKATVRLLSIGLPVSALSAVTLFVNSIYVILANWMGLGDTLGLIVFANTACTIVLFALNTVAWGATSRSMRDEYVGQPSQAERLHAGRLRTAFRVGSAAAALVCLSTSSVFIFVLKEYAGAEVYAFYLCLFQTYGLLLFGEINHLTVSGRSYWVIAGYCIILSVVWITNYAFPGVAITTLMLVGIVGYCLIAFAAVLYCEALRSDPRSDRESALSKLVYLLFPVSCALLYSSSGSAAAVAGCLAFAALALSSHSSRASGLLDGKK